MAVLKKTGNILKETANLSLLNSSLEDVSQKYEQAVEHFIETLSPPQEIKSKLEAGLVKNSFNSSLLKDETKLKVESLEPDKISHSTSEDTKISYDVKDLSAEVSLNESYLATSSEEGYYDNFIFSNESLAADDVDNSKEAKVVTLKNEVTNFDKYSASSEGEFGIEGHFDDISNVIGDASDIIGELSGIVDDISLIIDTIAGTIDTVNNTITEMSNILDSVGNVVGGLGNLFSDIGNGGGSLLEILIDISRIVKDISDIDQNFDEIVGGIIDIGDVDSVDIWEVIGDIGAGGGGIGDAVDDFTDFLDKIGKIAGSVKDYLIQFKEVIEMMKGNVDEMLLDPINEFKDEVNHAVRDLPSDIKHELDSCLETTELGKASNRIDTSVDSLDGVTDGMITDPWAASNAINLEVKNTFKEMKTEMSGTFDPIIDDMKDVVEKKLYGDPSAAEGTPEHDGVIGNIKGLFSAKVENMADQLKDSVSVDIFSGVIEDAIKNALDDLGDGIEGAFDGLTGRLDDKIEDIFDLIEDKIDDKFDELFENTLDLIQDEFDSMVDDVADQVEAGEITTVLQLKTALNEGYNDSINNALHEAQGQINEMLGEIYDIIDSEFLDVIQEISDILGQVSDLLGDTIDLLDSLDGADPEMVGSFDADDDDNDDEDDDGDIEFNFDDSGELGDMLKDLQLDINNDEIGSNLSNLVSDAFASSSGSSEVIKIIDHDFNLDIDDYGI